MSDEKILPKKSTPRTENLATLRLRAAHTRGDRRMRTGGAGAMSVVINRSLSTWITKIQARND